MPFAVTVTVVPLGSPQCAPITLTGTGCPTSARNPAVGLIVQACGPSHRTAWSTLSRPPVRVRPASAESGSTVRRSSASRPTPVAEGNLAFASAAAPETNGAAIEVPLSYAYELPGQVE